MLVYLTPLGAYAPLATTGAGAAGLAIQENPRRGASGLDQLKVQIPVTKKQENNDNEGEVRG
jgi:hypothetical protein